MSGCIAAVLGYNQPQLIDAVLEQFEYSNIVVIDNGSSTPYNVPVNVIRLPKNGYFSGGWQAAMPFLYSWDYVWMLNSDIEGVSNYMMNSLLEITKQVPCHVLSPSFNSPHQHMQPFGEKDVLRRVPWIDWCAPFVSTKWWKTMGGFDIAFKGYGADLDICKRARVFGLAEFFVVQGLSFYHQGSVTAFNEGLMGVQGDVGEMNRLIKERWNVSDWTGIAHG